MQRPQPCGGKQSWQSRMTRVLGPPCARLLLASEESLHQHHDEHALDDDAHHRLDGRNPGGSGPGTQLLEGCASVDGGEADEKRVPKRLQARLATKAMDSQQPVEDGEHEENDTVGRQDAAQPLAVARDEVEEP